MDFDSKYYTAVPETAIVPVISHTLVASSCSNVIVSCRLDEQSIGLCDRQDKKTGLLECSESTRVIPESWIIYTWALYASFLSYHDAMQEIPEWQ